MGFASGYRAVLLGGVTLGLTFLLAEGIRTVDLRFLVPAAAVGLAGLSIYLFKAEWIGLRGLLGLALLARLVLFPLPPALSDDVYRYIWDGLLQVNGINPFAFVPSDPALSRFHSEPIYALLNSRDYFSVYPPMSQGVFALGALVYDSGWEVSYFVIKAILVGAEVAALLLLARFASGRALALYAVNPVVLIEASAQPHTENLMLLALAALFWAMLKRRPSVAVVAATLSVFVKLYPAVLLPFVLRRAGWKHLAWVIATSALLAVPYLSPHTIRNVLTSLNLYVIDFEFSAGPYYVLKWVFNEWHVGGRAGWGRTIGPVLRTLFLVGLPLVYLADVRFRLRLPSVVLGLFGAYFALATTIHPWYLLGILVTIPLLSRPPWAWIWLSTALTGTYLFYTTGLYWPFVWIGWAGWLFLSLRPGVLRGWLATVMRYRAERKLDFLEPLMGGSAVGGPVLDLGAGDGYVGEAFARRHGVQVVLTDVVDYNKTDSPLTLYDGSNLPFADKSFQVVLLIFVLHHCRDAELSIREALRVARERVIVLESVYDGNLHRGLLQFLDRMANRLRSGGLMQAQEEHLTFRRAEEWIDLFERSGATVCGLTRKGRWVHRQLGVCLHPRGSRVENRAD